MTTSKPTFLTILDQQKIENGMRPPEIVQELIDKNLSRAQEVFKKNNKGEYPPSWRGYVSIYSMAQKVGSPLLELYEEYRDMSDYHHWGIQSLGGGRYKFDPEGRIFKDHVVDEFIIARCLYLILYSLDICYYPLLSCQVSELILLSSHLQLKAL